MSKPDSPFARPIPVGILVSVSDGPRRRERPTPKPRTPAPDRRAWAWIAIGGSTVWMLGLIGLAVCSLGQERARPAPQPIALSKPAATPVLLPAPKNAVEPIIPDMGDDLPLPPDEVPKLSRANPAPRPDDAPPPLEIPEPALRPQPPPAPPVEAPKPARKSVDLAVFADCNQIGADVLFMRDPPDAFKRAKAEKKMVFMVHLSGNLEDKEFT